MKMLPKDLDMNSSNSALLQDSLITTSCPDLSEAQKLLLDLHLDELALMEDAYEAHLENLEKNNPQSVQVYPDCFEGEMELDSNPVVLSAMVDNVYQNSKKSAALKSLDEQIMREMRLDDKLAKKLSNEDSDEELFDRLVNNTNANEKLTVGQTNLSLFEEFAEKELFDKLNKANQMKKSQSDTFASVKTHLQVDKKGNAQPYASERAKVKQDFNIIL